MRFKHERTMRFAIKYSKQTTSFEVDTYMGVRYCSINEMPTGLLFDEDK